MFKLLTFDVSYTLLTPMRAVSEQYAKALVNQVSGTICLDTVQTEYEKSHKRHSSILPIYGLNAKLTTKQWWESVFLTTLINSKLITTEGIEFVGDHANPELIANVPLIRLNPKTANTNLAKAFDDVYNNFEWKQLPYASEVLNQLNEIKNSGPDQSFAIAVISNNDERIHNILEKHGLLQFMDFVITSRETGYSKPDRRVFDLAIEMASNILDKEINSTETIHVGDSVNKDYFAAVKSGCRGLLLDPDHVYRDRENIPKDHCIDNLLGVLNHVC